MRQSTRRDGRRRPPLQASGEARRLRSAPRRPRRLPTPPAGDGPRPPMIARRAPDRRPAGRAAREAGRRARSRPPGPLWRPPSRAGVRTPASTRRPSLRSRPAESPPQRPRSLPPSCLSPGSPRSSRPREASRPARRRASRGASAIRPAYGPAYEQTARAASMIPEIRSTDALARAGANGMSAAASSATFPYRLLRSFSRHRKMTASSPTGTSGRSTRADGVGSLFDLDRQLRNRLCDERHRGP